jgi:hypothetical protein
MQNFFVTSFLVLKGSAIAKDKLAYVKASYRRWQ